MSVSVLRYGTSGWVKELDFRRLDRQRIQLNSSNYDYQHVGAPLQKGDWLVVANNGHGEKAIARLRHVQSDPIVNFYRSTQDGWKKLIDWNRLGFDVDDDLDVSLYGSCFADLPRKCIIAKYRKEERVTLILDGRTEDHEIEVIENLKISLDACDKAQETISNDIAIGLLAVELKDILPKIQKAAIAMSSNDPKKAEAGRMELVKYIVGQKVFTSFNIGPSSGSIPMGVLQTIDKAKFLETSENLDVWAKGSSYVQTDVQMFGSLFATLDSVIKTIEAGQKLKGNTDSQQTKDLHKKLRGQGASLAINAGKLAATVSKFVAVVGGAAVSAPIAGVVGAASTVRFIHKARKSGKRRLRLKDLQKQAYQEKIMEEVEILLEFALGKAKRKELFNVGSATVGAVGTTGAAIGTLQLFGVAGVLAAANGWNPVGWGIGAAVLIGGTGLIIYKLVRRAGSKKRAEKRKFSTGEFPRHLVNTFVKYHDQSPEGVLLGQILYAYGCCPEVFLDAREKTPPVDLTNAYVARVKRHLG